MISKPFWQQPYLINQIPENTLLELKYSIFYTSEVYILPSLPKIAIFNTKYFILSKVYTDTGGVQRFVRLYGDNPLAKARGLSPGTAGQTVLYYYLSDIRVHYQPPLPHPHTPPILVQHTRLLSTKLNIIITVSTQGINSQTDMLI